MTRPSGGSRLPQVAGACFILAALVSMAGSLWAAANPLSPEDLANQTANLTAGEVAFLYVCSLVSIWAQIFTLLGGIMAYQRSNWRLVVVCGVFSLLTLGFVLVESSILGALGLLLVLASRREFVS